MTTTSGGAHTASALIRQRILAGEFTPGQRIPPERELATTLGVSRSSVREAIRGLVSLNILQTRRGSGTYVRLLESSELFEAIDFVLDVDPDSLEHFFELRRLLEPPAAALAASRMSDVERARLLAARDVLSSLGRTSGDVDRLVATDATIHDAIASATGNPLAVAIIQSLRETASRSHQLASSYGVDDIDHAIRELTSLIDAVCQGDALKAQGVMMWHLESSLAGWHQQLSSPPPDK